MFALTYPPYIREKARQLRQERKLTIDEIAERLSLSRTTVYYWVRDMPIPITSKQSAAQRRATKRMQAHYRGLRDDAYREGQILFPHLLREPGFRDFVTLFIAEGYKRTRHEVSIANSDHTVMRLCVFWMRILSPKDPRLSIQYHADQDLDQIRAFWGEQLNVSPDEIRLQRKSNSNQLASRTWRSKNGVLTARTSDTYFRSRLEAWVDRLKASWLDSAQNGA